MRASILSPVGREFRRQDQILHPTGGVFPNHPCGPSYPKLSNAWSSIALTDDFDTGPFLKFTVTVALGRSMR